MSRQQEPPDFADLYDQYGERIYRFCHRLSGNRDDAEDLTQEVFVAAIEGHARFGGRSSISTWLYRIALYRWGARKGRKEFANVSLDQSHQDAAAPGHDQATQISLESAVAKLPEPLREAFLLVKGEGLTCVEAAAALRVPVGTLKFRVHSAMKRLQEDLGDTFAAEAKSASSKEVSHAL